MKNVFCPNTAKKKCQSSMDSLGPSEQQHFFLRCGIVCLYKVLGKHPAIQGHGVEFLPFRLGREGKNPCW